MFNLSRLLADAESIAKDRPRATAQQIVDELADDNDGLAPEERKMLLPIVERIVRSQQPRTGDATANG